MKLPFEHGFLGNIQNHNNRKNNTAITPWQGLFNDTLIIVALCNPITRLYRYYHRQMALAARTRSAVDFHQRVYSAIAHIFNCTKHYSDKHACLFSREWLPARDTASNETRLMISQLQQGLYGFRVRHWFKTRPRSSFLFIRTEDYQHDAQHVTQQLHNFLDVQSLPDDVNASDRDARRQDTDNDIGSAMLDHTHHLLDSFYTLSNKRLAQLLKQPHFAFKSYHLHRT